MSPQGQNLADIPRKPSLCCCCSSLTLLGHSQVFNPLLQKQSHGKLGWGPSRGTELARGGPWGHRRCHCNPRPFRASSTKSLLALLFTTAPLSALLHLPPFLHFQHFSAFPYFSTFRPFLHLPPLLHFSLLHFSTIFPLFHQFSTFHLFSTFPPFLHFPLLHFSIRSPHPLSISPQMGGEAQTLSVQNPL